MQRGRRRLLIAGVLLAGMASACGRGWCADPKPVETFVHDSKAFSITPPEGFLEVTPLDDGVRFINLISKSFMSITFTQMPEKITDAKLLLRFDDEKFRDEFVRGLEKGNAMMTSKVTDVKQATVNGIPGWEFDTEVEVGKEKKKNNLIVFFKNGREYFINLVSAMDQSEKERKALEDSLETFQGL